MDPDFRHTWAECCVMAIGRKNYPFAGSDRGDEPAAAMYSSMEGAKLNGTRSRSSRARCPHPHRRSPNCLATRNPAGEAAQLTTPSPSGCDSHAPLT